MKKYGSLLQSVNRIFSTNIQTHNHRTFLPKSKFNQLSFTTVSSQVHQIESLVKKHILFKQEESATLILERNFQTFQYLNYCQASNPTWFLAMSDNKFCIDYAKRQVKFTILLSKIDYCHYSLVGGLQKVQAKD